LLIVHLGAIAILLCFGVLHGGRGDYSFDALRAAQLQPAWASIAFLLAFFGFGAKAGMIPLHAWLPEAHPAAPSPVSALMSGIMLKTAIYGMVRVISDLIGNLRWEWGLVVLAVVRLRRSSACSTPSCKHDLKRCSLIIGREHRHYPARARHVDGVHRLRPPGSRGARPDRRFSTTRSTTPCSGAPLSRSGLGSCTPRACAT